ncbi:MAG TPA: GIY-YIG nuclease family protein [Xanthomonadales bacterium]|nr:GIY-YIG nuclease family protein [Xanthomonadales bacterium]
MPPRHPCVYIMTNKPRGTLYIGVTGWLLHRATQHREGTVPGFTSRYHLTRLVWIEHHGDFQSAIRRETCLKRWNRMWKIELVESGNPEWRDLYEEIVP